MSLYNIKVKNLNQDDVLLLAYKSKVLLIVNTAPKCGFAPQYEALEVLYKKYKNKGFEVLDFPCNQFLKQAPNSAKDINQQCQIDYGITYQTFDKIEVNGKNAHPLYQYLKKQKLKEMKNNLPCPLKRAFIDLFKTDRIGRIRWNFTKFLVDREGNVRFRFSPSFPPEKMSEYIELLLNESGVKKK
jgi:glutathione peroxidase